ncbi:class I SAM-dependent methyltransferase [Streptosporangium sp. NBC_01755]|uniref:class I SAM-dependent methyltransferase n=1 Tax=Streptosporangium sp. NBC_01755 TaxID=2975949 RepID=UPI002DDB7897|nr:class I SAM-dependent methyltransferase [Streptosporangium sp. NBC_01755]WSD04161.1 class I SAM-dependent methyltransferase [Streptosporangium sp. NBC_01755]
MSAAAAYDGFAETFADEAAGSAYNALYDRPTVLDLIGDVDGRRVLDAGCGPGLYLTELIARGADAIGFDQSADMVRHARRRLGPAVPVRRHDLDEPLDWLPDATIDLILATLVIHYVHDRVAALRELHRVLRPQGRLVLSTSHPAADWLADGGSYFDARHVDETWSCGLLHRYWRQPLQYWVEEFTAADFTIEHLVEHRPVPEMAHRYPAEYAKFPGPVMAPEPGTARRSRTHPSHPLQGPRSDRPRSDRPTRRARQPPSGAR